MTFARVFWPLVLAAALAACSGNLGGGQSTLPGMPQGGTNVQQIQPAAATPTPVSASNVATVGDTLTPQALPAINGWGGTIAFAKPSSPPSASPNPKSTATATPGAAASISPVSIGITTSVVEPTDAPRLGSGTKGRAKRDRNSISALFFISLLATADVTLGEYPKIAVTVPREIAATHRDDTYALALYDPEQKEKSYRLAVAERDLSSPLPGTLPAAPAATPVPTAVPAPTPFGMSNGPSAFTPPPVGPEAAGDSLPPEYVAFTATEMVLKLKANRPVVFALYAVPPQPTPSPSGSPAGKTSASPAPSPTTTAGSPAPVPTGATSTPPSGSALPESTVKPADLR